MNRFTAHLSATLLASLTMSLSTAAQAQGHAHGHHHHAHSANAASAPSAAATSELVDGEVRRIDRDNLKLTLKHGDIKHLDMPGMTMVFQVKDAAWLDGLQVGDRVQFTVERGASGFVVTSLKKAGS